MRHNYGRYEGPDRPAITLGPLSLFCHESGDRLAIRLRDLESEIRRQFTNLHWYPVDESFRIRGRYVPHDKPRTMELANNLGDVLTLRSSGSVALTIKGEALCLTAIDYDDRLWFVFSDQTGGGETYPAARFLYADMPDLDGRTTGRLQPGLQSALRVQSIHDLPAATAGKPAAGPDRGRRTRLPRPTLATRLPTVQVSDAVGANRSAAPRGEAIRVQAVQSG